MKPDYPSLLATAIEAAEKACAEILTIYHSRDFQAEAKGDLSPLTLADKKAHEVIVAMLEACHLPILSEEGKDVAYSVRRNWEYFWLVDPLDGTKEFIKRNGEFTVNIALVHQHAPVLGVVAVPVTGEVYYGLKGGGAFVKRAGETISLELRERIDLRRPGLRVVASRSHQDPDTELFVKALNGPTLVSSGSSLKFMLVASGKADVYPRMAPTMEWDTAAAHAIVNEVGLKVCGRGGAEELAYNKESLVNPHFLVY